MAQKTIDKKQLKHLAKLSSLSLAMAEEEKIGDQLSDTLEYVRNLQGLDTDNVKPTSHVVDSKNVVFADGSKNDRGLTVDEATRQAGQKKNGYFVTKRVLEK